MNNFYVHYIRISSTLTSWICGSVCNFLEGIQIGRYRLYCSTTNLKEKMLQKIWKKYVFKEHVWVLSIMTLLIRHITDIIRYSNLKFIRHEDCLIYVTGYITKWGKWKTVMDIWYTLTKQCKIYEISEGRRTHTFPALIWNTFYDFLLVNHNSFIENKICTLFRSLNVTMWVMNYYFD